MNWDFNSQEEKRPVKSEEVNDFEFAKCITLLSEEIMQARASRANGVLVRVGSSCEWGPRVSGILVRVGSSCEWGPRVRRLGRRLERQFIAHNHAENITIITRLVNQIRFRERRRAQTPWLLGLHHNQIRQDQKGNGSKCT